MMFHMHDCIRSEKKYFLTIWHILTYFFEHFGVDLTDDKQENRNSYLKGGGAVKQSKKKETRTGKDTIIEEEDESLLPPSSADTSSSNKYLVNDIVKDVLQEFVNLTKHLINSSKQARKLEIQNENSLRKSQDRVGVLLKYIDSLGDEMIQFDQEDEEILETKDE
ncbi:hypothetical protein AHAS_Ahas07G0091500 [Arachis hypogaea]